MADFDLTTTDIDKIIAIIKASNDPSTEAIMEVLADISDQVHAGRPILIAVTR
jgi:hypothetical protein